MHRDRIEKLISTITLDGCVIDNPQDLFYLTGLPLSKGRLWASIEGATLFVDGRYFAKAKKSVKCPVVLWEKGVFETFLKGVKRGSFDSAFLTVEEAKTLQKSMPHVDWVGAPHLLRDVRLCKDPQEIALLKKAADLTWQGYNRIVEVLEEGISEKEAAVEFQTFCLKNGASGFSFEPIVAFGENSAYPHHRASDTKLKNNQIVLIDVGAIFDRYCGDMTRVFFFGHPDPELKRMEQIVRRSWQKAAAAVRPGVKLGEIDRIVREEFRKDGVESLYVHSLGHGIGLDAHEYPRIHEKGEDKDAVFKKGMVFTIEPGLYKPGLGGIRLEDTFVVTEKGAESFYPG
jgi:Xaa-Pro aminopeptidase